MNQVFYLLKALLLTVVLVLLLQIQIEKKPAESYIQGFIKSSSITSPLREFAQIGAQAIQKGYRWTLGQMGKMSFSSHKEPNQSRLQFDFKRSPQAELPEKKQNNDN